MATTQAPPGPASGHVIGDQPGRRVRTVLIAVVLVIVVAEIVVRLGDSRLPVPIRWQSPEADTKVRQMDALSAQGGAGVVFVGSSLVNAGIEPATISAGAAPGRATVYNAALTAAVPTLTEAWTLRVVLPRLRPKVLIVGVTSFDFTDSPAASAFFNAFAESRGGRRVLGDNALNRVDDWLDEHSALWQHKLDLRSPKDVLDSLRGNRRNLQEDLIRRIGADGRTLYRGFGQFNPNRAGGPPVANWSVGRREPSALRRLITGAQRHGAAVVLVDMPVTNDYIERHPNDDADYARYLTQLRRVAADTRAQVLEFGTIRDEVFFADVVHLNARGAAELGPRVVAGLRSMALLPPPDR